MIGSASQLTRVAGPSKIASIVLGLFWGLLASVASAGAWSTLTFELPRLGNPEEQVEWIIVGVGAVSLLLAWIFAAAMVRRFRLARDSRVVLLAGTDGVRVTQPAGAKISRLLFDYSLVSEEFGWDELKTWYPFVSSVNGIPTVSQIVFEGIEGWHVRVNTLSFAGSRRTITDRIAAGREAPETRVEAAGSPGPSL